MVFKDHRGLSCYYSKYFRAALKGGFLEAITGKIYLTHEKPATYKLFQHWLYTNDLDERGIDLHLDEVPRPPPNFLAIIDLWLFADRREIPLLANDCIDSMRNLIVQHWLLPTSEMRYVYERTLPGSALRRYTIETMARVWREGNPKTLDDVDLTGEAWADLAKELVRRPTLLTQVQLDRVNMCRYHVHADGESCTAL